MLARTLAVAALGLGALFAAGSAQAAPPIVVGQATFDGAPDIAVDPGGTAHIAWNDSAPAIDEVRYCRLARGAGGCADSETFVGIQPGDQDSVHGRAHVFFSAPNAVTVFHQRGLTGSGHMMANRSTDGGLTFGARNRTGVSFSNSAAPDEAVYGPGNSITAITEVTTAGVFVQNGSPLDNTPSLGEAQLLSSDSGEDASIGIDPADNKPVAVYEIQSDPAQLAWRKLAGSPTEANINTPAQWGPQNILSADHISAADGTALAGGPNGLFLFFQQRQPDRGWVSKFTGSGWTAPVLISDGRPFNQYDLHQDASGRLHAVWNAYSDERLRYTWSDDGVNWSAAVDIARGESYPDVRVAAAADHQGFAVWNRGGPDVMAVPLEALPEPPVSPDVPPLDTTAPAVSGFGISGTTLLPGQGASFVFNATEAGTAVLTIQKRVKGLKMKKGGRLRCVPRTRKLLRRLRSSVDSAVAYRRLLRKRRCKVYKGIGRIRQAVGAGTNTIVFNGRIAGRKLGPGRYRALLKLTDLTGNVSRTEVVRFRVLRRRR
ncbi:MAG TPA: hypothetical protein VFB44_00310 [Thermoleophilaceae bacterium]|nr:hypothetical protein [Thermoleophilaceae bacterium]